MASSSSSDNSAAIKKSDNRTGSDQEIMQEVKQEDKHSLDANTAESAFAPPNPTPRPATESGVGLIRGGTGIGFNASDPFNGFSQNIGALGTISRPLFIPDKIITTDRGIQVYTKRSPDDMPVEGTGSSTTGGDTSHHKRPTMINNPYVPPASGFIHSNEDEKKVVHGNATRPPHSSFPRLIYSYYPNPMYPVFDPSRLTVDLPPLPMIPRQPYPPLVPNRDGSFIDRNPKGEPMEVVEDNLKEHEAQQRREVAAASSAESGSAIREGVVPVGRRYILPDLNFLPPPDEDVKDEEDIKP